MMLISSISIYLTVKLCVHTKARIQIQFQIINKNNKNRNVQLNMYTCKLRHGLEEKLFIVIFCQINL